MSIKVTTDDLIKRIKAVTGDNTSYNLSKVEYTGKYNEVCIECESHGEFYIRPSSIKPYNKYSNILCPKCKEIEITKALTMPLNEFINRSKVTHKGKYIYDNVANTYKNSKVKVEIICPKHGSFLQTPKEHIKGKGCSKCAKELLSSKFSDTTDVFIKKSIEKYGDKFTYENTIYINSSTPLVITCKDHGDFTIVPEYHLRKGRMGGCPRCSESKGEALIYAILDELDFSYIKELRIPSCKMKGHLSFDAVLIDDYGFIYGVIEYDGEQHFKPVRFNGTKDATNLEYVGLLDTYKNFYCAWNKIPILRIKYTTTPMQMKKSIQNLCADVVNTCGNHINTLVDIPEYIKACFMIQYDTIKKAPSL